MIPLIIINVVVIIAGGFLTPLWAGFVEKIGGNIITAGNAICIFSIVIGLLTCVAAKIENDYHKDEFFLVFSQVFMAIGYLGYFWVHHPWQLYLVEIWLGLGGAIQAPALYSLYQQYMPKDKGTLNWGIWNGFYNIAMGIGALISAYIANYFGFTGVFFVLFLVALLGVILSIIVAKKMKQFTSQKA